MLYYRELSRNKIAIKVATCFVEKDNAELVVYDKYLVRNKIS